MKISRMERGRKHQQGMNRIFILQKGKWKPFKMKAVCELVFYSESAMQFFIIVVIIMNSIKTSMLILKERLANHSNQDQSRLSPHLPLTKPIKLTKASLEKDCCRTSFLRFPLFTNSCYIYISMLVQIQSIF